MDVGVCASKHMPTHGNALTPTSDVIMLTLPTQLAQTAGKSTLTACLFVVAGCLFMNYCRENKDGV